MEILFAATSDEGFADVSASLNGRAGALIEFETKPSLGGEFVVRWYTVGVIDGRRAGETRARHLNVVLENYSQLGSVHPGENVLSFRTEVHGGMRIARATILSDSGVFSTELGPAQVTLELGLKQQDDLLQVGEEFAIGFTLRNVGDRAAHGVAVGAGFAADTIALLDTQRVQRFGSLDPGEVAQGTFRLRALGAGRHRIAIAVNSTSNRPQALIEAVVAPVFDADAISRRGLLLLALAAVPAVGGAAWAILRLRRRHRWRGGSPRHRERAS